MIGYKGFDKNLCCNGYQYVEGETFEHKGDAHIGSSGFHFCKFPVDVLTFYPKNEGNIYALVEALGDVVNDNDVYMTVKIKIVRIIPHDEYMELCSGMVSSERGFVWYKHGVIHRDNDLPAVYGIDNYNAWYKNGYLHRDNDLPAVIHPDGTQLWFKNGKFVKDNADVIMF